MDAKRNGRITASRALDFMTYTKPQYYTDNKANQKKGIVGEIKNKESVGFGETAKTYAKELALKRLGVDIEDDFTTWQMEWGNEWEPEARNVYANSRGVEVRMPEFITMGNDVGATPDGFVGLDGLLEIKCPQWKAHTDYLLNGPEKRYIYQMQFQMMVTGAEWTDFMTFHPHFPPQLTAKVFRIERDEELIRQFVDRIALFVPIIEGYVEQLKAI